MLASFKNNKEPARRASRTVRASYQKIIIEPPDRRKMQRSWYKSDSAMALNQETFRQAMGCFATGVTVITVDYEGEVQGMTANAFSSVSLDPLLVLVCVDQKARTHAHLHARKRFGINVLSEHQRAISEHYARPDRDPARA